MLMGIIAYTLLICLLICLLIMLLDKGTAR
jgi:hypothetical protein